MVSIGWAVLALAAAPAAGAPADPAALTEIADISGLTASPDGRWIAYRVERPSIEHDAIETVWFVVDNRALSPPRRLGSGGAAIWDSAGVVEAGRAVWRPDSGAIIVRALSEGRMVLRTLPIAAAPGEDIVADADIERFAVGDDGQLIYETGPSRDAIARAEAAERDEGIFVDDSVDLAQSLVGGGTINGRAATERWTGHWFERRGLLAGAPKSVKVKKVGDPGATTATEGETRRLTDRSPVLPDDAARALSGLDKGKIVSALPLPDGRWVVTLQDTAIGQSLYLWSGYSAPILLHRGHGLMNGGRDESAPCAAATAALLCVEADANQPPRLVRISLDGTPPDIVDEPNRNLSEGALLAVPLSWQVGGSRASGWLIRPKIPGRLPLFLTYYRCSGYLRGGLGDEWPLRALAESGIAALCINALPLDEPRAEARYDRGLAAVRAIVDRLSAEGVIDRSRVGMGGLSFGSEVALWTAANSDLLRAASIASVQIEPAYYWFNRIGDRGRFAPNFRKYWGLGAPEDDLAAWRRLSPALHADRIGIPVLMQLPEQEARLSPELHARLLQSGTAELRVFPQAPHIKVAPRQKLAAYRRNLDWFRFWLRDVADPSPAKADQYRRWEVMRAQRAASIERTQSSRSASSINRK